MCKSYELLSRVFDICSQPKLKLQKKRRNKVVFSVVLVSIEKIYQTLNRVFHQISKHLEAHQKYSAARCIFKSFFCVWKCEAM